jgi:microsomal dipeptidase-like Zn-dependent dipeptidase
MTKTDIPQVAGSDHVALGIGFESDVSPLVDLKSAADSPRLAADFRDAGMSEEDIARVFYKNARRVVAPRFYLALGAALASALGARWWCWRAPASK